VSCPSQTGAKFSFRSVTQVGNSSPICVSAGAGKQLAAHRTGYSRLVRRVCSNLLLARCVNEPEFYTGPERRRNRLPVSHTLRQTTERA
jgi:hypothetical protein